MNPNLIQFYTKQTAIVWAHTWRANPTDCIFVNKSFYFGKYEHVFSTNPCFSVKDKAPGFCVTTTQRPGGRSKPPARGVLPRGIPLSLLQRRAFVKIFFARFFYRQNVRNSTSIMKIYWKLQPDSQKSCYASGPINAGLGWDSFIAMRFYHDQSQVVCVSW